MSSAHSNNSQKLLNLKQAAEKLSVSVDVLLEWNEHHILKPTITTDGQIGYSEEQLDQFLKIKQANITPTSSSQPEKSTDTTSTNETPLSPVQTPSSPVVYEEKKQSIYEKIINWIGNGFYTDEYIKDYLKTQVKDSLTLSTQRPFLFF